MRRVLTFAVVVLGVAMAWWATRPREEAPPDDADAEILRGSAPSDAPALAVAPARVDPSAPGTRPSGVFGTVWRAGQPSPARVEVRATPDRTRGVAAYTPASIAAWVGGPLTPPAPIAIARAGADGRFEAAFSAAGYVEVLAVGDDGALGFSIAELRAEGARVEVRLELGEGSFPLRGRVMYGDGRPFRGRVFALPDRVTSRYAHRPVVETDTDGRFEIAGLPTGTASVTAFIPGEMRVIRRGIPVPPQGEVVLVVDDGLTPLSGRVLDDATGGPVVGATVAAMTHGGSTADVLVLTAADGTFTVPRDAQGWVYVTADGYVGLRLNPSEVTSPLEVRLVRPATVTGRVLRASDGTPVGGARVRAISLRSGVHGFAQGETWSDAEGRYEIGGLGPGEYAMTGTLGTLRSPTPLDLWRGDWGALAVTLAPSARVAMDVRLVPGGTVAGRTLDADGHPVARATVGIGEIVDTRLTSALNPLDRQEFSCATDIDGAYVIEGLPPDLAITLVAVAAGRPPAISGPVTPRAGETIRLDLHLDGGRVLDVVALDAATGRPIAGATATVRPSGNVPPASAVTDEDGRARIEGIAAGPLVLEIRAEGHAPWRVLAPTERGPIVARLAAGHVLEGRVLMPDGTPAGGANVSATASDGSGALGWTTTATDGTFRLGQLPDGELAIAVAWFGADHLFAEEAARPGSALVLRLSPNRPREVGRPAANPGAARPPSPSASPPSDDRFVGRVLDPEGRPIPRASARLVTSSGTWGLMVTGGRAIADRRPEHEATFEAWGALDLYRRRLPYGLARVVVPAGAAGAEVRLVPEVAVEGRVLGPDGRGVAGVVVYATEPDPGVNVLANLASTGGWSSARSDDEGTYRVGGLSAEPVELRVAPPDGFAPAPPVATRGGATGVEIRLKAGITPRLTIVDPAGRPLGGVRVAISEAGAPHGFGWPRTTDAQGVITWDALDPTLAYRLSVDPNPRQDLAELRIPRWTPKTETLRVPWSCDVRGVLLDGAGQPVARATVVRVVGSGEMELGAFTEADGRFEFHRVPEGEVVLRASLPGSLATTEATVTAAPDAPEVVLVLDLGTEWRLRIDGWAGAVPLGHVAYAGVYQGAPVLGAPRTAVEVATDGTFVVSGTRHDVNYTVWVPSGGDRYVLASGLQWSAEGATLTPSTGRWITGTVKVPDGVTGLRVWARRDALHVKGEVGADGRYIVRGLPPGSWTVVANAGASWSAEASTPAGGEADLTLKSTHRR